MNKIETGGPAFPLPLGTMNCSEPEQSGGMTLRDYFAAKAIPVLLTMSIDAEIPRGISPPDHIANKAYEIADSMLKAREA